MSMELWTAATPNGWKISIMIEELVAAGVELPPVTVREINLMDGEQFSAEFTAKNPNQKIPVLVDGGLAVFESAAALLYLAEKFPSPLLPQGKARWGVLPWLFWQAGNIGPVFGNKLSYTRYMDDVDTEQKKHPLERFSKEAQRLLRVLDKQLAGHDYICGADYTIADIACFPWVRGWKWSKIDITGHANVLAWVDRVRARPAVERGLVYGSSPEEADKWKESTRQRYRAAGASIASNTRIDSGAR